MPLSVVYALAQRLFGLVRKEFEVGRRQVHGPAWQPAGRVVLAAPSAVTVFLSGRWGILLWLAALLIGFARVYDGVHYPLDIAGGFLAALNGRMSAPTAS